MTSLIGVGCKFPPSVLRTHGVVALSLRLLASVLVRGIGGIVEEGEEGRAGRARRKHAEFTLRQERGSDRREKRREGEEGRRSVDAKIRQPEERLGGALLRGRDRAGGRRAVHEGGEDRGRIGSRASRRRMQSLLNRAGR